jgi:hypothetical protein
MKSITKVFTNKAVAKAKIMALPTAPSRLDGFFGKPVNSFFRYGVILPFIFVDKPVYHEQ